MKDLCYYCSKSPDSCNTPEYATGHDDGQYVYSCGYFNSDKDKTIAEMRELLNHALNAFDPVGYFGNNMKDIIRDKHEALHRIRLYLEETK